MEICQMTVINQKRYAIICETPFSVLNCINLVYHQNIIGHIDVYLSSAIPDCDKLANNLKIFLNIDNAYTFQYPRHLFQNKVLRKLLDISEKALCNLLPEMYLRLIVKEKLVSLNYHFILVQNYADFALTLICLQKGSSRVFFYEDGIGSYFGKLGWGSLSKRKFLYDLLKVNMDWFYPEKIYINNKALCKTEWTKDMCQMKTYKEFSSNYVELLVKIFNFKNTRLYKYHKRVYLTLPNDKFGKIKDSIDKNVLDLMKKYQVLIRPHPVDDHKPKKEEGFLLDAVNNLWEYECMNDIDENSVLISSFSTAQFSPKILFDKEPYIILIFPLYEDCYKNNQNYGASMVEKMYSFSAFIKSKYKEPEKVIIINSMTELEQSLNRFNKKYE